MPNITKSKSEQNKQDLETAQKIKPVLSNYLVKEQYDTAEKNARENAKKAEKMLSDEEVKLQCTRLSLRAFLDMKLWLQTPPPVEMAWIRGRKADGSVLTIEEMERERAIDIAGFSSFLLREYYDMQKQITSSEYPHPLSEKNLPFFWGKFCEDLKLLITADQRRMRLGNAGVVIADN